MKDHSTEYQDILKERFGNRELDQSDRLLLREISIVPGENGFQQEMLKWLKAHPNADLQELAEYEFRFLPPLEVVDDDELDEDERNELVYQD